MNSLFKLTNNIEEKVNQIRLGNALFDQSLRRITREKELYDLEPRVSELLALLCSTDTVLSRESILNSLWGDAGSDEALTQAISKLRRALGDTARPHKIIETLPKRGYRLLTNPERVHFDINLQDKNQDQKILERLFSNWNSTRYLYTFGMFTIAVLVLGGAKYLAIHEAKKIEIEFECSDNLSVEDCISLIEALDQKVK